MDFELENIKDKLFTVVIGRLYEFNQDFVFDWGDDRYYSPDDFVFTISPAEYKILDKWRKEKWN